MLQDDTFLKKWKFVSDALDIPTRDMFAMNNKLTCGNATMYDVIKWMLETWKGRKGKACNLAKLIETLEMEKFLNASGIIFLFYEINNEAVTNFTRLNCTSFNLI